VIISNKYKLIFVTTPKSGSHTGFMLMEDYFDAAAGFNHNLKIPGRCKNYHSFTFVRNPYERFCSLYHACVINDEKRFVPNYAKENILNYGAWYAGMAKRDSYPRIDLCAAQWKWHENSKIDEYVQIEEAQYRFAALDIPHELKREHPTWKDVKNDELTMYVNIWAGKDFELYGYNKDENTSS